MWSIFRARHPQANCITINILADKAPKVRHYSGTAMILHCFPRKQILWNHIAHLPLQSFSVCRSDHKTLINLYISAQFYRTKISKLLNS